MCRYIREEYRNLCLGSGVNWIVALWDMAALEVIVNEAGGRFSNFTGIDGSSGPGAISSNHLLHDLVLTELK